MTLSTGKFKSQKRYILRRICSEHSSLALTETFVTSSEESQTIKKRKKNFGGKGTFFSSVTKMALWRIHPVGVAWLLTTITGTIVQMSLCRAETTLEDNGYKGVVVVINRDVPEDMVLLRKLEECLTEASKVLFRATRNLLYFEEFVIIIPQDWSRNEKYSNVFNDEDSRQQVILITKRKSQLGDKPYVKVYQGCGKPGLHMHLTASYLTNDSVSAKLGPCGKVFVHEWAHLRWGLFDEYPKRKDRHTGRCSKGPTPVASLMYATNIESITQFCEFPQGINNTEVHHNRKVVNLQNSLCQQRSAWEVMWLHSDFQQKFRLLDSFEQTRPIRFKYVQVQAPRRVLVLDTSGSMQTDNRLTTMNNAASSVILTILKTDSSLGIVRFSDTASVLSEAGTVKTQADRKALISRLPTSAGGSTSIGAGLRLGLEVLHRGMDTATGGTIILISDGEENRPPLMADVRPEILQRSVVVHIIGVTELADHFMSNLSTSTGGSSFFAPGDYNSTALFDSLAAIFTSRGLTHDPSIPLLLQTEAGSVSRDRSLTGKFCVDSTLGHNTTVIVSFTTPVDVTLTGPDDVMISRHTHPRLYLTDISGILQIDLSDYVENATWTYDITTSDVASSHVVITVQSNAKQQGSEVTRVSAWLAEDQSLVFAPDRKLGIYAEAARGSSSVLNAKVVALVERPNSDPLRLELFDNGFGSDTIKDDGIYSAYILAKDLTGNGRYSIKILVEGVEGFTSVAVGGQGRFSGSPYVNTTEDGDEDEEEELVTEPLGRFQRVTSAGVFSVTGFPVGMTSVPDQIPPSRITDLSVSSKDTRPGEAELEWTSVGGDMDRGAAANYTFYFTSDLDLIPPGGSNDSMWSEINETYLLDLKPPQPAGNRERMKVDLALLGDNDTLFLCLRATDDSGNAGELSNIVSITRFRDADVPPETTEAEHVPPETTDVDHVPPETTDVDHVPPGRDAGFYVLVTVLPILAALALLVTGLLLAVRRSRKRKSLHVQKKMEEASKTVESPLLLVSVP